LRVCELWMLCCGVVGLDIHIQYATKLSKFLHSAFDASGKECENSVR
jgi:hypothetical protein